MILAHDSLIVQTLTRALLPVIQLFALYVLFFGQYGPGGGFVGGVMFGASLILSFLVFGADDTAQDILGRVAFQTDGLGLIIFAGIGGLCMVFAGEFLNYAAIPLPGLDVAATRSLGIVGTQIGVAVDVAVTSISIVYSLSLRNEHGRAHD
ncbi:MAG TPA: cation:proton antiporter [Nitrospirales bacterium]|nr:cation:proton antiporter [Nitrospirales bacterium]